MNLLIITSVIPYPLEEGGKISQFAFIEKMQHLLALNLLLIANSDEDYKNATILKTVLPNTKIEIINNIPALPIISFKRRVINKIKYIRHSFKKVNPPSPINEYDLHFNPFYPLSENIITCIHDFIARIEPNIIQIDHNNLLNLVTSFNGSYKTVFIEHEIQYAKLYSFKAPETVYEHYVYDLRKNSELNLLSYYDAIFTLSEDDKNKLSNSLVNKVFSSPFPILDRDFNEVPLEQFKLEKLVFIGPASHYPNNDGAVWFLHEMAEIIFNKTGLTTHIVGKWSLEKQAEFNKEFIVFDGFVENLDQALSNSIVIVPIRIGSGIRTKILYALAKNCPVVTTSIGCEGIGLTNNLNALIADDNTQFIESIIKLANDKHFAYNLANQGYKYAKEHFSQEVLVKKRFELYELTLNKENAI